MEEERIMTLHPQGKQGVNILKRKYEIIKDYILKTVEEHGEITYQSLDDMARRELEHSFDGKVAWYIVSVKLDLEARGVIERIPKTSPHKLRIRT